MIYMTSRHGHIGADSEPWLWLVPGRQCRCIWCRYWCMWEEFPVAVGHLLVVNFAEADAEQPEPRPSLDHLQSLHFGIFRRYQTPISGNVAWTRSGHFKLVQKFWGLTDRLNGPKLPMWKFGMSFKNIPWHFRTFLVARFLKFSMITTFSNFS